jgi:hypothetical protein
MVSKQFAQGYFSRDYRHDSIFVIVELQYNKIQLTNKIT